MPESRKKLPSDFDASVYLELNPDVSRAGVNPAEHYIKFGISEGRIYKHLAGKPSNLDYLLHNNPGTKRPKFGSHEGIWKWIEEKFAAVNNLSVLEIGSRNVVSDSICRKVLPRSNYIGFDI